MIRRLVAGAVAVALAAGLAGHGHPALAEPRPSIAMHGAPRYPEGFVHFDYANPSAPQGGRLTLSRPAASFDSLNPFIIKGEPASGLSDYLYEPLMARSRDEPFTLYGLLAESIDVPDDRSSVTFVLRPEARFSDGYPVTPDDVLFTWELLRKSGRPNHVEYYGKVARAERVGERGIRFTFEAAAAGDRELPLIMGLMPILPRHAIDPATFERTTLEPPIGSGPYVIAKVDAGRSVLYRRDPDWWGRTLPVNRGRFNFEEIRFEYFRDSIAAFEAFKAGTIDAVLETDPGKWATAYDFPAVARGEVLKEELPIGTPSGMSALVMNTRRAPFANAAVRRALNLLFDFDWMNRTLYHGLYSRTGSYFDRSELAALGHPAAAVERALLAAFPEAVSPEVMAGTWQPPGGGGASGLRDRLRQAIGLLASAGYVLRAGKLVEAGSGTPFRIEMLAGSREHERLMLAYATGLRRAGIEVAIRQVDSAEFQARLGEFDFDMIQFLWPASLSPGNEQSYRFGSAQADSKGSWNFPGVRSEAVDAMIRALVAARTREELVSAARALDRVLVSGDYVVPLFHTPTQWLARWRRIGRPAVTPLQGAQIDCWWLEPATPP